MNLEHCLATVLPAAAVRLAAILVRALLIVSIAAFSDINGGEFVYWNA